MSCHTGTPRARSASLIPVTKLRSRLLCARNTMPVSGASARAAAVLETMRGVPCVRAFNLQMGRTIARQWKGRQLFALSWLRWKSPQLRVTDCGESAIDLMPCRIAPAASAVVAPGLDILGNEQAPRRFPACRFPLGPHLRRCRERTRSVVSHTRGACDALHGRCRIALGCNVIWRRHAAFQGLPPTKSAG